MKSPDLSAEQLFAPAAADLEKRADGSMVLRSPIEARQTSRSVVHWLKQGAAQHPDRPFLGERAGSDDAWSLITYDETWQQVRAVGTWLLGQNLSADRPVVILSDNSIDHALLALASMAVGIPVATVSPAYSLLSQDHAKLAAMIQLLTPGVLYVSDTGRYDSALQALASVHQATIVASLDNGAGAISFETLTRSVDGNAVDRALEQVNADTIARFLFTSGSTGSPKAVINTQRMLCASQDAKAKIWPFLATTPPIIVDWLPWSHTFGANHNFNMVLRNGGTLYIDGGRPAPGLADVTAANIEAIGPNLCFNVPRGYEMLVQSLQSSPQLCRRFFGNVNIIFYAAAALPQAVWETLRELSLRTTGRETPMVSAWGSTETSPLATDCHFQAERSGNIGLPVPGVELKLVPDGNKLEIRVRGQNVTPGYWRQPELTAAAFDDEGFYRIGDAVRLADEKHPEKGLYFDGRVAEDFKLSSGTFVNVGQLRLDGLAALAPVAQDIVVTGHDRNEIGFLIFPNLAACRQLTGLDAQTPAEQLIAHPRVKACVAAGLAALRKHGGGSSRFATRGRLLASAARVDAGEITDKGYINQRAVIRNRAADIALMLSDNPDACITTAETGSP